MNGIDPMFIYSETPVNPMEVAYTCVFDPSTAPGGYSFDRLRGVLTERLPTLRPFRRRLMEVPLGLDHPRWVDDPDFDLDDHLHRAALPSPGGPSELSELATDVIGRPLDPGQAPWEMHVIEGFCGGKVALIAKVHHAVIDGVSGAELLARLLDMTPEGPETTEIAPPARVPALPSGIQMAAQAVPNVLTSPVRVLRAARELGRTSVRLARHAREVGVAAFPIPLGTPAQFATQMNATRAVSFAEVSLGDVDALKERFDVTLNDVVLAMCSGALRTYLAEHDQETSDSLVAVVPISVRRQSEQDALGNRLSAMFVPLASDRGQPLERLDAVADASASAKAQERAVGFSALASSVADAVPPFLARPALRLGAQLGALRRLHPANLMISNVPGPKVPLFFAGMRMEAVYPIGPVIDGVALNITVQSYLDSLFVGLNACPDVVPDLDALAGSVVEELGHLTRAAQRGSPGARRGTPGARPVPRSAVPRPATRSNVRPRSSRPAQTRAARVAPAKSRAASR
ncbi:MAG: wax ester/triacylglycerol synthase family O-acyltransferase [Acidimicrobiales bacterium]